MISMISHPKLQVNPTGLYKLTLILRPNIKLAAERNNLLILAVHIAFHKFTDSYRMQYPPLSCQNHSPFHIPQLGIGIG